MDRVRAAAIRTLFVQIRTSIASGAIVTAYTVLVSLPYTRWPIVMTWAAAQIATQLGREVLRRAWHRAQPDDAALVGWVHAYTALMAMSGVVWGSAIVVLAHPEQPITVALTLCALFGMCGGAVAGQSYNPSGLYALIWGTFLIVFGRLVLTGEWGYVLVGVTCVTFAMAMSAYGRVQRKVLDDGYRIRFENAELVAALTEQKAQAEDARHKAELANLAKSQFLAAASHDLRQPLYALSLFSSSLGELALDVEGRNVVTGIQDSIAVMESLFDGLLDISKLEAGVVRPRFADISVDALFDRLSQVFRPIALDRGLDLRFRSDGEWVRSDAVLLEQVLSNLVSNAIRCTPAGAILVAARRRNSAVRLEVWDTGIGIAAVDRERIFDEFVQLDNDARDRRKGLGLGLSIARRAAALIGATIEVASHDGRGSRFAIAQPEAAPAAVEPVSIVRHPARPRAGLVMLVDDDRDVRAALADLLTRWGVAFDAFADADSALGSIDRGARYGLVLADYRLGGAITGLDLLTAIAERHPVPVPQRVLVTGDFDPALIGAAHARRVALLHKPLARDALRKLLGLAA